MITYISCHLVLHDFGTPIAVLRSDVCHQHATFEQNETAQKHPCRHTAAKLHACDSSSALEERDTGVVDRRGGQTMPDMQQLQGCKTYISTQSITQTHNHTTTRKRANALTRSTQLQTDRQLLYNCVL